MATGFFPRELTKKEKAKMKKERIKLLLEYAKKSKVELIDTILSEYGNELTEEEKQLLNNN